MLLLVGKSCSGKSTIAKELKKLGLKEVIPYTTRPPREDETEGIEYHFITKSDFLERKEQGFFAETSSFIVATEETWYYGSAVQDLTDDKVSIVNPKGLKQIKNVKSLNLIIFYIMADKETIWTRLEQRGDNFVEAKRRMNEDEKDFVDIDKEIDFAFRNDLGLKPELLAEMILHTYNKVKNLKQA